MVFAAAAIALMTADHRYRHLEDLRAGLSVVVYPIRYVADLPVQAWGWARESLANRQALLEENAALRRQQLLLDAQLQKLAALETENIRLRELLESSLKVGERVLVAELLSVDLDPYRHRVIINKGTTSGAYPGQPLIDAEGVMGQLVHVGPASSVATLITDPNHAVPVQVNRNGLRTIAVGTGRINELDLPYLPNNADIEVGDLLVTSGLGGRFPPGYPVGRVNRVEKDPRENFAAVHARPSAQLDRTRQTLLVWSETRTGGAQPSSAGPAEAAP